MRSLLLAAATLAFSLSACAQGSEAPVAEAEAAAPTFKVDPTHASLVWKVDHLGLSKYTARFTGIDATLVFDPEDPASASLTATVNPLSVETDYPLEYTETHPDAEYATFDEALAYDWFKAAEFPSITFTSTAIDVTGENTGTVTGGLTFLGVTQPVTLDVTFNGAADMRGTKRIGFSATGSLDRTAFGQENGLGFIGETVNFLIEIEFVQE